MMTIKDSAGQASAYAKEKASSAKLAASDAYATAKLTTSDAYVNAKTATTDAYATAKVRTADGIDTNPIAALIGGLALGALAAAVLPRTRKEDELLGDLGGKINDTARNAAQAATDAGRDKLEEMGINKDTAMDKAKELAQGVAGAARESASAAVSSVKKNS